MTTILSIIACAALLLVRWIVVVAVDTAGALHRRRKSRAAAAVIAEARAIRAPHYPVDHSQVRKLRKPQAVGRTLDERLPTPISTPGGGVPCPR